MNQRLRAAFLTAGLLCSVVILTLGFRLVFTYITPEMVPFILTGIGMAICIYVMYRMILTIIQDKDRLKDMVDRK
jgi:hypothetical protein